MVTKETEMSVEASRMFPGFRFSPTDVELITHYLKKKLEGSDKSVDVISQVEIWRHEPWDLPSKSIFPSENEWFFFSTRGRKYPNGTQSRRATELGYWKATGKERNVKSGIEVIGSKRTLVFHLGRAPKGERTEWIMHEYSIRESLQDSLVICRLRKNMDFRQNEASNRQRPSTTMENTTQVPSEGGIDCMGIDMSEGEKAAECSKKCSSSYDSHSIEQFDSASESGYLPSNDITLAESSTQHEDDSNEEDFFADILKDEIIKLDEPPEPRIPEAIPFLHVVPGNPTVELPIRPQPPADLVASQAVALHGIPLQGDADRRIKLRRPVPRLPSTELSRGSNENEEDKRRTTSPRSQRQPFCFYTTTVSAITGKPRVKSIVFATLTLLVLLLSLLLCSKQIKRVA